MFSLVTGPTVGKTTWQVAGISLIRRYIDGKYGRIWGSVTTGQILFYLNRLSGCTSMSCSWQQSRQELLSPQHSGRCVRQLLDKPHSTVPWFDLLLHSTDRHQTKGHVQEDVGHCRPQRNKLIIATLYFDREGRKQCASPLSIILCCRYSYSAERDTGSTSI